MPAWLHAHRRRPRRRGACAQVRRDDSRVEAALEHRGRIATESDTASRRRHASKLLRQDGELAAADDLLADHIEGRADELTTRERIDVLCTLAENFRIRGHLDEAWTRHIQLLRAANDYVDTGLWLWAVTGLARIASIQEQHGVALYLFRIAAAMARGAGDDRHLGWCLRGLADASIRVPDSVPDLALELLDAATALFTSTDYAIGRLWVLQSIGDACQVLGDDQRALAAYAESRDGFRERDARGVAFASARWALLAAGSAGPMRMRSNRRSRRLGRSSSRTTSLRVSPCCRRMDTLGYPRVQRPVRPSGGLPTPRTRHAGCHGRGSRGRRDARGSS